MTYTLVFTEQAQEDWNFWRTSGNKTTIKKITALLEDIAAHPFTGIGKPEALKYELSGTWSRRINSEHRIVYRIIDSIVEVQILAMRYYYKQ